MSNAYINVPAAFVSSTFFAFGFFIRLPAGLLVPCGFGRRRDGISRNRRNRLPLHLRQNVCDRLQRLCSRDNGGQRKRDNFYHGPVPKENRKNPFTILDVLLHRRNEGSVKHSMFKCILDNVETTCVYGDYASGNGLAFGEGVI